jgi:hypothetical protein
MLQSTQKGDVLWGFPQVNKRPARHRLMIFLLSLGVALIDAYLIDENW